MPRTSRRPEPDDGGLGSAGMPADKTYCLTMGCHKPAGDVTTFRGMCLKCYGSAKRAVEKGNTTWDELERLGMVLPREQDPFAAALRRKQQGGG